MNLKKLSMTIASALLPLAAMAGNGVELEHLGVDNTLLRITGEGRYLILPQHAGHYRDPGGRRLLCAEIFS